jgi:Cft2 family RNA processing exonuclease
MQYGFCLHKFTYHAVGQGLFFDATFRLNDRKFYNIVYECGAEQSSYSNLRNAISFYKGRISCNDTLVISHFDYDHVSGIKILLENCNVAQIVLPYLTDDEILMIY